MSRRVSLPGADELFGSTDAAPTSTTSTSQPGTSAESSEDAERGTAEPATTATARYRTKGGSGRIRHDEKITVYVTADELHELESTRLFLRRDHGLAVDRGRIVRAAVTLALEAVEAEGENSPLVRRLRAQ